MTHRSAPHHDCGSDRSSPAARPAKERIPKRFSTARRYASPLVPVFLASSRQCIFVWPNCRQHAIARDVTLDQAHRAERVDGARLNRLHQHVIPEFEPSLSAIPAEDGTMAHPLEDSTLGNAGFHDLSLKL